jgi:hypothetical protein
MCMNYIISHTRNGEVTDNTNAEENQVTGIRRAKESIPCALNLAYIQLEHLLLYLADNTAEDVGYRKPKENIDIPGNPLGKCMLQAVKDGKAKNQRSQNGKHDQIKGTYRIDTENSRSIDYL